jgi:hypothetical protein
MSLPCDALDLDGHDCCAAFEYNVDEWLIIDETIVDLGDYQVIERVTTCIHCGQSDVCYPL